MEKEAKMRRVITAVAFLLSDLIMLLLSFFLSYWMRVWALPALGLLPPGFFPLEHFGPLSTVLLVFILVFFYERLYSDPLDPYEEFLHLARGLILAVILISVFVYFSGLIDVFARTILFMIPIWGAVLLPVGRWLTRRTLRKTGFYRRNCALVGREAAVLSFLGNKQALMRLGFKLSGWIGLEEKGLDLPHLGPWQGLEQIVADKHLDSLFLLSEGIADEELKPLVNLSEHLVAELRIVPKVGPMHGLATEIEYLDDQLLLKNRNNLFSAWNRLVKRIFDLLISFLLLVIFGLPLLLVALIIRLDSKGPALFWQERFGRSGKTFLLCKFRTMYLDNEVRLEAFLLRHPQGRHEWQEFKKIKSLPDPRVTQIGRWLRRFSIDEWPQLWQVFIGEMSLVGPRPYLVREQEDIRDSAAVIFRVKSGLTGLWQIRGRNELPFRERVRLDEYYVRNWSLSLDLLILLKTFMVVVRGKGAY